MRRSVPGFVVAGAYVVTAIVLVVMGWNDPFGHPLIIPIMPEVVLAGLVLPAGFARSAIWQVIFPAFILLSIFINALLLYAFCAYLKPEPALRQPPILGHRLFFSDSPAQTLFVWTFFLLFLGGFAGMFVNFIPYEEIFVPSAVLALGLTAILVWKWAVIVPRSGSPLLRRPFMLLSITVIFFGMVGFLYFLLFFVSLPALVTEVAGRPYRAEDRVVTLENCRGRKCRFCTRSLALARHQGFGAFCLDAGQLPQLKAGDRILVVGKASPLGIRVKAFRDPDARPRGF